VAYKMWDAELLEAQQSRKWVFQSMTKLESKLARKWVSVQNREYIT